MDLIEILDVSKKSIIIFIRGIKWLKKAKIKEKRQKK